MTALTRDEVMFRLQGVIDPCSAATRAPLSIVEMGMIENVEISSGDVLVELRMTSPFCHALPYFEMQIQHVLEDIPEFRKLTCTFDHGGAWEPEHMTAGGRQKLADQRERVRIRVGM